MATKNPIALYSGKLKELQSGDTLPVAAIPSLAAIYQPLDGTLTALSGANWAANSLPIGSGSDTVAQVTFAANTFPARSSSGNLVAKTITDFGLSLVDDSDAAAGRTTLGLGTISVQAANAVAIAGGSINDCYFNTARFINASGLLLLDDINTYELGVTLGETLSDNRSLTLLIGDTDRTLTLAGNATISGTHSGTSSGTNTGDQTITLTGDVTGSGTGSFAATIANSAVTLAKMANMATASLIYRKTAGTGAPEVNTLATLKTDLGLTGTNSGDQTSIVGISGTKAQFNTANTDGDFIFTSDIGSTVQAYDADLTTWAGITPGTNVGTALAVNVGTAGAFVVNGGALGTPSSGTLTNCTFPTLNQNTTGSAAKWTTARNLAGNSVDGSANVAFANKFIVQGTADSGLSAAQFLGALGTGIVKNTTTTGVLSIAVAGDFPTLNQNTTGSAATLTTARAIYGNNFDGSAALTQIIASTYGGTGNGFAKFSGPATSEKTFTLPNASATILTDNAAVTVAQGGTGRATSTTAYGLIAAGTTATGAHQTLAAGGTTEILVGGGASALPVWTTATGSGSPVRATSPTFSTSMVLGTDIVGAGTRFVMANASADVYSVRGQDSTHNLQVNWRYNATAANAYGEIVTWGYNNPIKIDASEVRLQSVNTGGKISFFGATAVVQPTTAGAAATFTANSGTAVNDASTFDGYTIKQVVKALRNLGILA